MSKLPVILPSGNVEVTQFQDMWAIDDTQLNNISKFISKGDFASWFISLFRDTSNSVTSVMTYPFSLASVHSGSESNVVIAGKPATVWGDIITAPRLTKTVATPVKFGMNVPTPVNIDFLDYEPFTTYQMYIPFVGVVDLNARNILGKSLTLEYVVDFHTGGCTVYLYNNTENLYTTSFQIGTAIPFGATNEGDAKTQRTLGAIKTGLTMGFGAIGTPGKDITKTTSAQTIKGYSGTESFTPRTSPTTGRLLKPAQSMSTRESTIVKGPVTETTSYPATEGRPDPATLANGILNMANDKVSYIQGAPGGDFSQFTCPSTPYLIITRTHIHDIEDYGHYFGYACAERIRLGDHHGYCEISNIHMEGMSGVTASEIDVIAHYLKNGVILP